MEKSRVALVRCEEYQDERVLQSVRKGIELLGGISRFVKPGEKIVLKPNVLFGMDPQKCVTTHPSVLKAAGKVLQEAGVKVYYGDSSGIGSSEGHLRRAGLKEAADSLGILLADFDKGREVSHKSALQNKKFIIANGVLDSNGLISLSKMKTHGLVRFTGAVKNQFGCIPGMLKPQFHVKLADPYRFATMLVDINTLVCPRLFVMDGIMAMEGNGPRNGNPRPMNVLLFSTDPIALDSIACKMINLNPEFVPTSRPGEQSGLGTYHYENIEVLGDDLQSFVVKDFQVVRRPPVAATSGKLRSFLKNQVTSRPVIDRSKCTACGTCLKVCPVGEPALKWASQKNGKFPEHNYNQCIRCYCCQEMCPEGAITINSPWLGKLIFRG